MDLAAILMIIAAVMGFAVGFLSGAMWQQTKAEKAYCDKLEKDFEDAESNLK